MQNQSARPQMPIAPPPSLGVTTPVITIPQIDPFARQASVPDELERQPLRMSENGPRGDEQDDDDNIWVVS